MVPLLSYTKMAAQQEKSLLQFAKSEFIIKNATCGNFRFDIFPVNNGEYVECVYYKTMILRIFSLSSTVRVK